MKKNIALIFLLLPSVFFAQNLAAYVDQRGYFNVFDKGQTTVLEYNAPTSFEVGGACIAYVDYNSNFKVYYNGEVKTLYGGPPNKFLVTHNILFYNIAGQLRIFDRGETRNLTINPGPYEIADSLVAFCDNLYLTFNAYYNKQVIELENGLLNAPLLALKASNNTIGYVTNSRDFKVFWHGQTFTIFTLSPNSGLDFQTGSDILAFLAGPAGTGLSVFYKGNTITLTSLPIITYKACDDMVAYEDQNGLHAFSNGKNYDLCPSAGLSWDASDSVLAFSVPGYFKVFNRGKVTTLCNYKPDEFAMDNNTLAWINQQGGLNAYYNLDTYDLSGFDKVLFKLTGNALWFKSQTSSNQVFLCGKTY